MIFKDAATLQLGYLGLFTQFSLKKTPSETHQRGLPTPFSFFSKFYLSVSPLFPFRFNSREQLLVVLLTVAKTVLEDKIVEPKLSSFPGRLAPVLLQVWLLYSYEL